MPCEYNTVQAFGVNKMFLRCIKSIKSDILNVTKDLNIYIYITVYTKTEQHNFFNIDNK